MAQTPDDKLIVPRVRIGKWTLKMTIPDLEARMSLADMMTIYDKTGIAFRINNYWGDIEEVTIFRPGSAKTL